MPITMAHTLVFQSNRNCIFLFSSCFFDGVKGNVIELFVATVPQVIIILMNSILYFLTWLKIRKQQPNLKSMPGYQECVVKRAHKAAQNMTLLIVAFSVQWIASTIYGIWRALDIPVPLQLMQTAMTAANVGGVLNGIVFAILRHQKISQQKEELPLTQAQQKQHHRLHRNPAIHY